MRFFLNIYKRFSIWQFSFNILNVWKNLLFLLIIKLACIPVQAKVLELVAGISLKSTGCIKLPIQTKIWFVAIFLVIFLLTCDILVMPLHYLSWVMIYYFPVFCYVGALKLLLWLKSKKHKESVSLPSLMENYQKSYTVHNFWVNGCKLQDWTRESLKIVLSMED